MEPSRRRSERLLLTFPIRVEGADTKGTEFSETTRTLVVNRHGARIQLARLVPPGQTLRIVNLAGNRPADFRVVGPTQPVGHQGGEWGVELLDEKKNIWGIEFPPLENNDLPCSALLECRVCQTVGLTNMSLVELDVLNSSGLLNRPCAKCGDDTPWGYPHQSVGGMAPGDPETAAGEGARGASALKERRAAPRVSLRLPIRARNWYGTEEFTKSENVSKTGLAFISEKRYEIGEAIQITCPYNPGADNIESRARVVRRTEMEGTGRWVYGVRYELAT
jgi:hypothetical protein